MTGGFDEDVFLKRNGVGEGRYMALVAWDVVCRPLHSGGLGVLHMQSMNLVLLTRWAGRIMSPLEN